MTKQFEIVWIDGKREPKCPPDPRFPNGMDVNGAGSARRACKADLAYPAKRCGVYFVRCNVCGYTMVLTTAGRPDDPRSVTIPCKELAHG